MGASRSSIALPSVDPHGHYRLCPDITVVDRGPGTVQIGTEAPRRRLLTNAPEDTLAVLSQLDGTTPLVDITASAEDGALQWQPIIRDLLAARLLEPAHTRTPSTTEFNAERISLIHQYGVAATDRVLTARSDALVIVEGHHRLAEYLVDVLAAAGVGHLYHPREHALSTSPSRHDRRKPAPQTPPSLVVLADRTPTDPARAAELVTSLIPHLIVEVTHARTIIGPLVLPGRSVCVNCMNRHRTDADPQWSQVAAALRRGASTPSVLACHQAADAAANEVLTFLDQQNTPVTIDTTLQRAHGSLSLYRRRWTPHPSCRCHLMGSHL